MLYRTLIEKEAMHAPDIQGQPRPLGHKKGRHRDCHTHKRKADKSTRSLAYGVQTPCALCLRSHGAAAVGPWALPLAGHAKHGPGWESRGPMSGGAPPTKVPILVPTVDNHQKAQALAWSIRRGKRQTLLICRGLEFFSSWGGGKHNLTSKQNNFSFCHIHPLNISRTLLVIHSQWFPFWSLSTLNTQLSQSQILFFIVV